jgi:hypothetical protein
MQRFMTKTQLTLHLGSLIFKTLLTSLLWSSDYSAVENVAPKL